MQPVSLEVQGLTKVFGDRVIFAAVNLSLHESSSLALTGRNGSGKSTMLKILAGVLSPTSGNIQLSVASYRIKAADRFAYLGFVAPYLQLYEEFTGSENLKMLSRMRGAGMQNSHLQMLLERMGLAQRSSDLVRTYSSGMKQRLKYAFALIHQPPILFLDEPSTNLDPEGVSVVLEVVEEQKRKGLLIVATNDPQEATWCEQVLNLDTVPRPIAGRIS